MDLRFGDFLLKARERQVTGPGGTLDLSARSFDILAFLLQHPGQLIAKDQLFDAVWPGVTVEENTLQVHVSALRKLIGNAFITTVHGRGYKYTGPPPMKDAPGVTAAGQGVDSRPVIAVLPFANLSGDSGQDYFSDGITEDIIDRLAKYRVLAIVGLHSSFALRGRDDDLAELRRKLAADYVLSGNVRKSDKRVRIAARLTDARGGGVLWAEHYDRPLEDVFALQDEVAGIIASTLRGQLEINAGTRGPAGHPELSSHEQVLRGAWLFRTLTVEGNNAAAACFRAAIDLNPANAYAYRWLSACYINYWFIDHRRADLAAGLELARRSAALDPTNALCHTACGILELWAEGPDVAAATYRKAMALNPDDPHVLAEVGLLHAYRGDLALAHEQFDRAEQLNPLPPLWYAEFRGIAAFAEGRYADALPGFAAVPECSYDTTYAMACLGHLGDRAGIAAILPRIAARQWDLLTVAGDEPFVHAEPRQRLIDGVTKAFALAKS